MDITQSVDILGLSAKLHQMTEDNSSWFGNLLQFQPGKIITRRNFTDPNCMFCFCVSMQLDKKSSSRQTLGWPEKAWSESLKQL